MLLIFIQLVNVLIPSAVTVPVVYDQRQSGNSNVRFDLRDAVLIAVADAFGDYDYTYDYSDLTVKPEEPSSTTSKPVTTEEKPETSTVQPQNATIIIDKDNSTLTFLSKPGNETSEPEKLSLVNVRPPQLVNQDYQIPVIVVHDVKDNPKLLPVKIVEKSAAAVAKENQSGVVQSRICSAGFFLDSHNRCKRIRKPVRENPRT